MNGLNGLINITTMTGTNVLGYTTKSHFLDCDIKLINDSISMNITEPNYDKDDIYLYIEQNSGTVFLNYLTNQLNFEISSYDILGLRNLPNVLLPTFYFITHAYAPSQAIKNYKDTLNAIEAITQVSIYGGPTFAVICIGIASWLVLRRKSKHKLLDDGIYIFIFLMLQSYY